MLTAHAHPINSLSLLAMLCSFVHIAHKTCSAGTMPILVCHERRVCRVRSSQWNYAIELSKDRTHTWPSKASKKDEFSNNNNKNTIRSSRERMLLQLIYSEALNMAIDLNKNMKKKKIIADNFTIWFYCLCASFFCLTAFYFCHPTCSEASKVSGFILCGFEWNERIAETLIYCIWHFFGSMRNIFLYQIDFLRIPKKNQFIPIRNVLHWPSPHVFHVIRFTVNFTKRCPRTTYVGHFIVDFIG